MTSFLAQFDALGWSVVVGSLLLMGLFLWFLFDDRTRREAPPSVRPDRPTAAGPDDAASAAGAGSGGKDAAAPHPRRRGRAA